ncbi:MAG TPA: hypothetical protein VHY48_02755 [Acidobacteriaceae bacterium]|jgi:hypothetical protein|nr:hypothetical protein [Acidobacteriaceae bacterium]
MGDLRNPDAKIIGRVGKGQMSFLGRLLSRFEHGHKRLLGESLREIGVLLLVFVPLDGFLSQNRQAQSMIGSPHLLWLNRFGKNNIEITLFALIGIFLLVFGIYIEREAELALESSSKGGS